MSKILTIEGLRKYTHELITRLGLTNDTGAYAYASYTGTDRATVVKYALDELYDKLDAMRADGLADLTVTQADGADYVTVELTNADGESLGKFTLSPADDHISLTVDGSEIGLGLSVSDAWADADDTDILTKIAVDAMLQEASTAVDIEWKSGYEAGVTGDIELEEVPFGADGSIRSFMYRQGASQWQNIIIDEDTVKAFTDDKIANVEVGNALEVDTMIKTGWTVNGLPANFDVNYPGSFLIITHSDANTGAQEKVASLIPVESLLKGVVNGNGIKVENGTISLNINSTVDNYVNLQFLMGKLDVSYMPVLGELPESSMPKANGVAVENKILHRLTKDEVPAYLKDENAEPAYVYWNGSDATVLEGLTAEQQASGNYQLYVLLDKDAATDTKLLGATYRGGAIGAKTKEFIDGPIALVREKDSAAEYASCDYVLLEAAVLRRGMLGGEIQSDNKVFTTGQDWDGLITATNIAAIGNQLNEIIDTLAESIDGAHSDVTTTGEEITVEESADSTTGAVTYDIRYATVTDADIESIFG
jgi:hypothetical protein